MRIGRSSVLSLSAASYAGLYARRCEFSAVGLCGALDGAKQGERQEGSPRVCTWQRALRRRVNRAVWWQGLIFEFSMALDLDGDDFDIRDYPYVAVRFATANPRRRLIVTRVAKCGVFAVTVTGRPRWISIY